tara:strand:- start:1958 stop:2827 length:870 start_codon:yes stop_codon:yes gene_type:complete
MYFDEDLILDLRLNTLNKFVDYFVIVESTFTHKGDKRNLNFKIENFPEYKNKIIYLVYNEQPNNIEEIEENDSKNRKSEKYIWNAIKRENGQRNYINKSLTNLNNQDLILLSDIDEIPNLSKVDLGKINQKIILFKQNMFYYKFNLKVPNLIWTGTKACRKKDFVNAQWLRDVKDRKYPFYRIDTIFSKNKFRDVMVINNGGWHFTNIKTPKEIKYKLESYLHHREFELNPLSEKDIEELINSKKAIYDLNADKRLLKFGKGQELEKIDINKLPKYIKENIDKYRDWLD